MYEKVMTEMFEGSLYGKGWGQLLVMSYALSNARPDKDGGLQVDLNPRALADKFGVKEQEVQEAIDLLTQDDDRNLERKLEKSGPFSYSIVNGRQYRSLQVEEERRERAKIGMRKVREKKGALTK